MTTLEIGRVEQTLAATLRALALPRRALPIGAAFAALLIAELLASESFVAVLWDTGLLCVFLVFGPHGYLVLGARPGVGLAGYAALGTAMVLGYAALVFGALGQDWTYVLDPGALGALVVLFLVGGWGLGRDIALEADLTVKGAQAERAALLAQKNAIEAEAQSLRAEQNALLALRAQLDPHFLFNTLNAIAEWCRQDPVVAEAATLRLSRMLRAMLDATEGASWPLARELELVNDLKELYALRDAARFRIRLELPRPLPDLAVPPMLLLPIVENAVTHGPLAGHEGEVVLVLREVGDAVEIVVSNPGTYAGRREDGRGIAIVEKRIALAYADAARFRIGSEGGRTSAELRLPVRAPVEAA